MPKPKERMAGYIRESDPTLADSVTIDSAAKAIREYGLRKDYEYNPEHEYKEAISGYSVPYYQREALMNAFKAAEHGEFDVFVITEVRALSRKGQAEAFVIYETLKKCGVRLETLEGPFEDTAMGHIMLGIKAGMAELERDQAYERMQRGKRDRIAIGNAPNGHPYAAYGYIFVDGEREVKARYEFNKTIIYVDRDGVEWSEYSVAIKIFDLLKQGESIRRVVAFLNDTGIPTPRKSRKGVSHWQPGTIHRMIQNRIYIGEVWANRYRKVTSEKTKKASLVKRPQEEWILIEGIAPALIDCDTFEAIQQQLLYNKQDSLRNNSLQKHDKSLGLLRSGFARCGICKRAMHVDHPGPAALKNRCSAQYRCRQKAGSQHGLLHNHSVQIHVPTLDAAAWEKVVEILNNPEMVRARVTQLREENKKAIDVASVEATIEDLSTQITNLFELAKHARDKDTINRLGATMNELEKQKQVARGILLDLEEDDQKRAVVEAEIVKFERWVERVRPLLTDPTYTPTYQEQRLAVRIIGIRVYVYPSSGGDWPGRYQIDVTLPEIMAKVDSVTNQASISAPFAPM